MSFPEMPDHVFTFGSNTMGRHGKGAALFAVKHRGAVYGRGVGYQGNSYAIPTKNGQLQTLRLGVISGHVDHFLRFAAWRPDLRFQVTPIGCGLAGYRPEQIAPMFADAPDNCVLPEEFLEVLGRPGANSRKTG